MNEEFDFSICEFIKENMWFFTYYDFCDNSKGIKRMFSDLDKHQKQFYKWYVYSNIHMDLHYKNAIWDYLNDYVDEKFLLAKKQFYKAK